MFRFECGKKASEKIGHIRGKLLDFGVVKILDFGQHVMGLFRHHVYSHSLPAESTTATDSVYVVL